MTQVLPLLIDELISKQFNIFYLWSKNSGIICFVALASDLQFK